MRTAYHQLLDEDLTARLMRRLRGDFPVLAITLILFNICAALLATRGIEYDLGSLIVNAQLYVWALGLLFVVHLIRELWRERPKSPLGLIHRNYLSNRIFLERSLAGVPILLMQIGLLPFFSAIKSAIPTFHTYNWDATFIALDRLLFFGHDPWKLLHPALGYAPVTALLAAIYSGWLALNYVGCAWILYARISEAVRRQFFLCFALSWSVIGGVMATLLASYGPAFIGPQLGNPHFVAQMAYLRDANQQIPVLSINAQQYLLSHFRDSNSGLGSGISAMPSMHVAICCLFYLAMRTIAPRKSKWFLALLVVIWVSSVHLAFHYAVDGLVSILAVAVLWRLSGAFIAWWDRKIDAARIQPTLRTNTVPAE